MTRVLISLTLALVSFLGHTSETPQQLILCHEDQNAYPWVMNLNGQSEGLDVELLNLVGDQLSISISYQSLPWKRCLTHLQQGKVDGAFAASFKKERLSMGLYPVTPKGNLDANKRIHTSGYSLYTLQGSTLGWNGETFINLEGEIAIQNGFSIGDRLKQQRIPVVEFNGPKENLVKIMERRVQGAALQTERADFVLKTTPKIQKHVAKYPVPISSKPYYLMLSFQLVREHPEFADKLWGTIASVRDSTTMQQTRKEFFKIVEP